MGKRKEVTKIILELIISILCLAIAKPVLSFNSTDAYNYSENWFGDTTNARANTPNAIGYKSTWYNIWSNPNHENIYYNSYALSDGGTDCANYVSQCLIAGGLGPFIENYISNNAVVGGAKFIYSDPQYRDTGQMSNQPIGMAGGGLNGVLVNAEQLLQFLIHRYHALYIRGRGDTGLGVPVQGDPYIYGYYRLNPETHINELHHHATITATGTGENSTTNAHTNDRHHARMYPVGFDENKHFLHMVPSVPYVKQVIIKQGGQTVYSAHWQEHSENPLIRTLIPTTQDQRNPLIANSQTALSIALDFNESISTDPIVIIGGVPVTNGAFTNDIHTSWGATLPKSSMDNGALDSINLISITASNYANSSSQLDADPSTVAQWNGVDGFTFYENSSTNATTDTTGGADRKHWITIQSQTSPQQRDIMYRHTSDRYIVLGTQKGFTLDEIATMKFTPLFYQAGPLFDSLSFKPVVFCFPLEPFQTIGPYIITTFVQDLDDPPKINDQINPTNIRRLIYSEDRGSTWQTIPMTFIGQTDIYGDEYNYQGQIPDMPTALEGTVVQYYIEAQDKDGNRATDPQSLTYTARPSTFYQFTIDRTPPIITVTAEPNPFSPNGDGVNDRTLINYQVTDTSDFVAQLNMQLIDSQGNTQTVWPQTDYFPCPGSDAIIWDGQNLPDGNYLLQVTAIDRAYHLGAGQCSVTIDRAPPVITTPTVSIAPGNHPGIFTSNDTQINLGYQLKDTLSTAVDVQIQFTSGSIVIVFDQQVSVTPSAQQAVNYSWDGKDTFGQYAPDGLYGGTIIAIDNAGNSTLPVAIPGFQITRAPATVTSLIVDNTLFTPDDGPLGQGDGNQDTVTVAYQLSKPAQAEMVIKNSLGQVLGQITPAGTTLTGSCTWDGKIGGVFVSDGIYSFQLNTADSSGNTSFAMIQVIKNQVPAKILFPQKGDTVANTVVITGLALDPGDLSPEIKAT